MKTNLVSGRQNGATAVEFALILWVFLLIVFGIVEWSVYLFNRHILTNASRSGARHGIIQASPRVPASEIQQVVEDYSKTHLVTFGAKNTPKVDAIAYKPDGTTATQCSEFDDRLKVTVSYDYTFLLLPTLTQNNVLPGVHTIVAATTMKCE